MEVVILLVALVGVALLVIPRMQRRRSGARRPATAKTRRSSVKRGRARKSAAAPVVASSAVATWTPPASTASGPTPAPADLDGWEDDLGWEGVGGTAPEAREAWEQWRATESPLAASAAAEPVAAPEPEPELELPSVERWRAKAAEEHDWDEDDDGLGWEGEKDAGRASSSSREPTAWSNGDGRAPVAEPGPWSGESRRDFTRGPEAPARDGDAAPTFAAAASAATDTARAPEPELGRTIALEDDDWDPPITRTWGAPADAPVAVPAKKSAGPARRKPRKARMHPVLLVAIYAAAGIGVVVLA